MEPPVVPLSWDKKFQCPPLHLSLDQGAGQRATAKIKLLCPRTSQYKITTWLSKKVKNWYFFFFFSFSFFPFFFLLHRDGTGQPVKIRSIPSRILRFVLDLKGCPSPSCPVQWKDFELVPLKKLLSLCPRKLQCPVPFENLQLAYIYGGNSKLIGYLKSLI